MTHLAQAPVKYVLGVVRFPRISDLTKLASYVQPQLRGEYPVSDEFTAPHVEVRADAAGVNISQNELRFWQFANADRTWAVFLGADMLALHTCAYIGHDDFIERFVSVLRPAIEAPDVGIQWLQLAAMRYINLVTPAASDQLASYLEPRFLPPDIGEVSGLEFDGGVMASSFRSRSGTMRVQVQRKPPTVLPPELISPMVLANKWEPTRPDRDFAVVDLDHGRLFQPLQATAGLDIQKLMLELHTMIRAVFDTVATPHALAAWSGDEK